MTLEEAAEKLVQRLRSSPSDDICERMQERGERVDALIVQAKSDWESGSTVLRELLARVEAARDRLREARGHMQEDLEEIGKPLEAAASAAIEACDKAEGGLAASQPACAQLAKDVEAETTQWSRSTSEFVVDALERKGDAVAQAHADLARLIPSVVTGELTKHEELARAAEQDAGKTSSKALDLLNGAYEQLAVRIGTASALASSQGAKRVSPHAASVVKAAMVDGEEAQQAVFDVAGSTLVEARDAVDTLAAGVQAEAERIAAAVEGVDAAIDRSAAANAGASSALGAAADRLQLFSSEP
jgi:hypothetical protein